MTALRFVTFVLLLSMVTASGAAASPAPPGGCGAPALRDLRIHLIDAAGVVPRTLDDAKEEVGRIWTTAGLRLSWTVPPMGFEITHPGTVVVIVRRALSRHSAVKSDTSRGVPDAALGWVLFDGDDQRGIVEVSIDAITAVVMEGVLANKSVLTLPRRTQKDLLGRGLGRVIAHEIGHWRMGRGHVRAGLMKASLSARDLIDWAAPPLPRRWKAGECEGRP
ncbi:MAG TPA: hypothetical protein VFT24_10745 [Vicinamibacterales bacterium]|nr:hypothetical protein [Vicinamibacterales bacterium]